MTKVRNENEKKQRSRETKTTKEVLEKINLKVAGIDIGSESMVVAILDQPAKSFKTFTPDLIQAVDYLKENQIEGVVMEATGIYWLPIYEILDSHKFKVCVVNGAHAKNVPGRKTDVLDSEWLRELHTYGLFRSSFIPDDNIRELRYYVRLRDDHIAMSTSHVLHIQKNMDAMNIKLHKVISDIMGVSGQKVIRAILKGERKAENLLELCSPGIQKDKKDAVISSLTGNYRNEYLFGMGQALQMWDHYQQQIFACDKAIEKLLQTMTKDLPLPTQLSEPKRIMHHKPIIKNFHLLMIKLLGGNDPTSIAGINDYSLLKVISEVGLDLSKWKSVKHFTSWLGLTPGANQSGKMKKKKRRKVFNKAGQAFRQLAQNVGNGKHNALSGFYKRIKARTGAKTAVKATARKIAVYFFNLMTQGFTFVEEGIKRYEDRYKQQQRKYILRKAKELGLEFVSN